MGYGLFLIKDVFIKGVIILCLLLIQVINPNIQSFDVTVNKNYPVVNVFNNFIKEYNISAKDFIIMPYLNKYAKIYYKDLNFMDFDYCELKTNSKNGIIKVNGQISIDTLYNDLSNDPYAKRIPQIQFLFVCKSSQQMRCHRLVLLY